MPKLKVVPAGEFTDLVADRLDGITRAKVHEVIKAMEAEVSDCIANGYGVTVGSLVKIEPAYKAPLERGKRFSPFDGETKMRPGKPASIRVKARALAGTKRDIPGPKTAKFAALAKKLPKPKKKKS